jgi:hypothetical protein
MKGSARFDDCGSMQPLVRLLQQERPMRPLAGFEMPSMLPEPGTTEGIECGCTCPVIAHQTATDEAELSGVLMMSDANCPLHGTPPLGLSMPFEAKLGVAAAR